MSGGVTSEAPGLASRFRDGVPDLEVITDPALCAFFSADVAGAAAEPAAMVLRPSDAAAALRLVSLARQEGVALFPRGGGWSYTGGYRPHGQRSAIVDSARLQGIAIDREAGTVEVGAGLTWDGLHAGLAASGLRARSFGPLSGYGATVGGGAAQNGGFFGTAGYGALGDGTVCGGMMVTGAGDFHTLGPEDRIDGIRAPQPLVGDCGAFGLRVSVVLRTMALPEAIGFASFDFPGPDVALSALRQLAGIPGLGEAYVFDPGTHANLARTGFSVIESAGMAADLLSARGGLAGRLGGLLRTARAGKAFVADLHWSLHVSFEGTPATVAAARKAVLARAAAAGGEPIPDVIPRVTRARPFRRIKALLGPEGEAWLPVHGVFAPEDAAAGLQAAQRELGASAEEMTRHGIRAVMLSVLMGSRIVIEPQLFWPDALGPAVRHMALPEQVAAFGAAPANPAARAAAHALRGRLTAALGGAGAAHFQIGRSYAVPPGAADALAALKRRFDPDGIMNPGALAL